MWARERDDAIVARFFFLKGGSLVEDPGTGSACANLGGWLVATGAPRPVALTVRQGEHTGRLCQLGLRVDSEKRIYVTGNVIAIATGEVTLRARAAEGAKTPERREAQKTRKVWRSEES